VKFKKETVMSEQEMNQEAGSQQNEIGAAVVENEVPQEQQKQQPQQVQQVQQQQQPPQEPVKPVNEINPEMITNKIDLLADLNVTLTVEVGRANIKIRDLLNLRKDSIVELDKAAGDPVEIYANGRLISKGNIIVVNGKYCIKLTAIISEPGNDFNNAGNKDGN
jgi:flagellar motor switch protein FliN/FliY